jgi:glycyl-tRNA synthetase beta chain
MAYARPMTAQGHSHSHPLLLEIGTEELPSSFVDAALAALPPLMSARLGELRLLHGDVKALGTPRRLSVIVKEVAMAQLDLDEEVVGPPEGAAFKDGKPTKAAEAFAQKLGVSIDKIAVVEKPALGKQKAGRYVVGRRVEKGRPARELFGRVLADVCAKIPFKKSMRWGDSDATFGRPIQWIVALFGEEIVDMSFAGIRSGNTSRGHRFLAPAPVKIESAHTYVEQLRKAHVIVDREERARTMMDRVALAAKAAGGVHDSEPSLVDENASLVEEPHVVTGSFDPAYLELPAAVIRAVARGHQKYFCVEDAKNPDKLLPHYIAVANTAIVPANVAKGNDRAMRPRLADARFFFEEDKKGHLEDKVEKLRGIVFHNRLGTVFDKVGRIERLSKKIAHLTGEDAELSMRAARLCKADLPSLMVSEFPELQGHMGRAYALHAKEPPQVADAIRDHYRPLGASDDVASAGPSAVVALADRIDTLTGCFAVGLAPTGAADPFALRRACIGALRILMDNGDTRPRWADVPLVDLVREAYGYFEGKKLDLSLDEASVKIEEFATERLRGLLSSMASTQVADAILGGHAFVNDTVRSVVTYPAHAVWKARALQKAVDSKEAWLDNARTVTKRLAGISKQTEPRFHSIAALGPTDADAKKNGLIVSLVEKVDAATKDLAGLALIESALKSMRDVALGLDKVFSELLVNDPADPLTPKRLELLSYGAGCMLRIGDFSRLSHGASV